MRLAWRIDALDAWRKGIEDEFATLRGELDAVTKSQEIAKAVAVELSKHASPPAERVAEAVAERGTKLALTWYQKLGGAIMGAIVVIDALRGLVS